MQPFSYTIPIHRFDLELLPPQSRTIGSSAFKRAVTEHFAREYEGKGETVVVAVDSEQITVLTFPGHVDPFQSVIEMLQSGRIKEALPLLETIASAQNDNAEILYNLGIAYSELGRFDDALEQLTKAVALNPAYSHAWTGIGVAHKRLGNVDEAIKALNKAVEADPGDGYAHRNLGAILAEAGKLKDALLHLREAFHQLPDDPQTIFGLAHCLETSGGDTEVSEADGLYSSLIGRFPASPATEMAREARTKIAQRNLRAAGPGGFRPDVMMYIAGAFDTFEIVGQKQRQEIAFEIALLGQRGLDINDPEQKYTLKTLPGKFSGLHLVSIMYTAFRQMDPSLNSGVDFSKEFELAQKMKK